MMVPANRAFARDWLTPKCQMAWATSLRQKSRGEETRGLRGGADQGDVRGKGCGSGNNLRGQWSRRLTLSKRVSSDAGFNSNV